MYGCVKHTRSINVAKWRFRSEFCCNKVYRRGRYPGSYYFPGFYLCRPVYKIRTGLTFMECLGGKDLRKFHGKLCEILDRHGSRKEYFISLLICY